VRLLRDARPRLRLGRAQLAFVQRMCNSASIARIDR